MKPLARERLKRYAEIARPFPEREYINLNPIQRGGVLTEEARRVLLEFGDGYSMCDLCLEGRIDRIKHPPIVEFLEDLATFLGMDVARIVTRCREGKFIAFSMLGKPGDYVVVDSLAHYSTYVAAEAVGLRVKEVPNNGYPEYRLDLQAYRDKVEEVERETGKLPVALLLTHVDPAYGNLNDPKPVAKIAHEYGIPFILNAAYTAGVMPIDGKELGVDIIVSSGHKSWAACAPIGIMAMTNEMAERILATSAIEGNWSKRRFPVKEFALLGCTVGGAPLATLMASFPRVVERVKYWNEEVEKAHFFVSQLERIEGAKQLGAKPKQHTLMHFESSGFHKVAQRHKRRGYFLYEELKKRRVVGIQPGLTKHFKLNTYGLTLDEVKYAAEAFLDIARLYGLEID